MSRGLWSRGKLLPLAALLAVAIAVVVIAKSSGGSAGGSTGITTTFTAPPLDTTPTSPPPTGRQGPVAATVDPATVASRRPTSLARDLGQMIVGSFDGTNPPAAFLDGIRAGAIGGVILFSANTGGGSPTVTRSVVGQLQAAARAGGNPGLLIMVDQEGGLVKRLSGPPSLAASDMGSPGVAGGQGRATARLLRSAGVNIDLAPVADVSRVDGFIARQRRSFGTSAGPVAAAACAFAEGLRSGGIAFTLKHFPGLGSAVKSTDNGSVTLSQRTATIRADEAAYRRCGSGPLALVMVSSAAYASLTGSLPAVVSPVIYDSELPRAGVDAVTISDDLAAPAITALATPAARAINAGLDLLLYGQGGPSAADTYTRLLSAARSGAVRADRIAAAAVRIRALKRSLGIG